jgi:hypothetical protein
MSYQCTPFCYQSKSTLGRLRRLDDLPSWVINVSQYATKVSPLWYLVDLPSWVINVPHFAVKVIPLWVASLRSATCRFALMKYQCTPFCYQSKSTMGRLPPVGDCPSWVINVGHFAIKVIPHWYRLPRCLPGGRLRRPPPSVTCCYVITIWPQSECTLGRLPPVGDPFISK